MIGAIVIDKQAELRELIQGSGKVQPATEGTRLLRPQATTERYSNAQLDDYSGGRGLQHRAPLSLELYARFSHPAAALRGTAGFGFWNAPFAPGSWRFRLPRTAWFFFGSPPLNLPLAMDVPGWGFKAATMAAQNWRFYGLLPTAPLGFLLMRWPWFYRHFWGLGQRALKVSEALLSHDMTASHHYRIDWLPHEVLFSIDGAVIHRSPYSPKGAMGLVIWIDNQYAVVTPQGRFRWGLVAADSPQWMDITGLRLFSPG